MAKKLSNNKKINDIAKIAEAQGWRVIKGGSNHILFYPPDKKEGLVSMSSTPSSPRNFKNIIQILKSKGLDIDKAHYQ